MVWNHTEQFLGRDKSKNSSKKRYLRIWKKNEKQKEKLNSETWNKHIL